MLHELLRIFRSGNPLKEMADEQKLNAKELLTEPGNE